MHRVPALAARLCLWSLLALSAVSSPAWALASVPSSPPSSWIYDGASLLSASERSELAARKQQLEQQTGARLVVVTLSSSDGESPKSIAVRTLNTWNAGRKSALLLVLMSPRELYIQPGTELASVLDASSSSSICSSVVAPKMRSGDKAAALLAGLEAMAARIVSASDTPSARDEDLLPTAQTRGASVPLRQFGQSSEVSASSGSSSWAWLGLVGVMVGVAGLGGGALWMSRHFARKCSKCHSPMKKTSKVVSQASYSSPGKGKHTYSCRSCGHSFGEAFVIAQLVESTTSSTSSSTSHSWSSSSSDSSWSSSSSDSSSSSGSSSDSSGGGGSNW